MFITARCPNCGRKLMEIDGKAQTKCARCKSLVDVDSGRQQISRLVF